MTNTENSRLRTVEGELPEQESREMSEFISHLLVEKDPQTVIEQLQQELNEERYRHDRLQDFVVAQGEELDRVRRALAMSSLVKRGRWEFKHDPISDPKGYFIRIVCSECNLHTGQKSNYCPQCGAMMGD